MASVASCCETAKVDQAAEQLPDVLRELDLIN